MRKRYRVLIFAALVAALVVPVGYALSVESLPAAPATRYATVVPAPAAIVPAAAAAAVVAAPITLRAAADRAAAQSLSTTSDVAQLFGIGTLLFGLAAFVRKAI
jgi:uncharacterized membrane protein